MPRARNIKHDLFTNDELADIEPLGRLLFIGLWTVADYKGDLEWNHRKIKVQLLPYDDCDIQKLAINLDKSGFIRFYSDGIKTFVRVVNFSKHQNPHKNEKLKGSNIPEYSKDMRQLIDIKGLAINLDKPGLNHDENVTAPADSLSPIPDSLSPIPESSAGKKLPFSSFYEKYPVKKSKAQAEKSWNKLNDEDKALATESVEKFISGIAEGISPPHPSTYLNNKRWEDEPATKLNNGEQVVLASSHKHFEKPEQITKARPDKSLKETLAEHRQQMGVSHG